MRRGDAWAYATRRSKRTTGTTDREFSTYSLLCRAQYSTEVVGVQRGEQRVEQVLNRQHMYDRFK